MSKFIDLTGDRYGKLLVIKRDFTREKVHWECLCDCGTIKTVARSALRSGLTQSCGCLHRSIASNTSYKHGMTKSSEYASWAGMKSRCYRITDQNYTDYGGRGIKVCDRWLNSFKNFYDDMCVKPSKNHSIDRINNDGNYEPNNCRWATWKQQANNRRRRGMSKNNTTGITGVSPAGNKFAVFLQGRSLGLYKDFFEACCIRKSAEKRRGYYT